MVDEEDYVELGLACADVCTALDRGLKGKLLDGLNNSCFRSQDRGGHPKGYRQAE